MVVPSATCILGWIRSSRQGCRARSQSRLAVVSDPLQLKVGKCTVASKLKVTSLGNSESHGMVIVDDPAMRRDQGCGEEPCGMATVLVKLISTVLKNGFVIGAECANPISMGLNGSCRFD